MEYIREVKIIVYIDSNKQTIEREIIPYEDEDWHEFIERAKDEVGEVLEN